MRSNSRRTSRSLNYEWTFAHLIVSMTTRADALGNVRNLFFMQGAFSARCLFLESIISPTSGAPCRHSAGEKNRAHIPFFFGTCKPCLLSAPKRFLALFAKNRFFSFPLSFPWQICAAKKCSDNNYYKMIMNTKRWNGYAVSAVWAVLDSKASSIWGRRRYERVVCGEGAADSFARNFSASLLMLLGDSR